jgi:hypothetical protein
MKTGASMTRGCLATLGKLLCIAGVQRRYEQGRGEVELPCPICKPDEFKVWADNWKAAPKPEKPKPATLFDQPEDQNQNAA